MGLPFPEDNAAVLNYTSCGHGLSHVQQKERNMLILIWKHTDRFLSSEIMKYRMSWNNGVS